MLPLLTGKRSHTLFFALFILLLPLLLYNLGGWGVMETSEARYAEISREMLQSEDWLHPRLLGIQHYHKPPITYLITASGMGILGVNEAGARFFLQLSLLAQACLVYLIGRGLFRNNTIAMTAMAVYITIPAVLLSTRNLTTDSFLTTFELLAIWAWIRYKPRKTAGWLYLFYGALALAFLTKGPVGLIFPLLVVVGYRVATPVKPSIPHHVIGFLFFLLLASSWYVYLMLKNAQFVDYFIINHTVNRYASPETFGRSQPWWFYLVLAPALSLPWSLLLLLQIRKLKSLDKPYKRLFGCWLLIPLVFFSFSGSKLLPYILPLFSGMALLVAWLLQQLPETTLRRASTWTLGYFVVLTLSLAVLHVLKTEIPLPLWTLVFPLLMLLGLLLIWRKAQNLLLRTLGSALLFTFLLVPYSSHLLGANPSFFNSTAQLAAVLKQEGLHHRPIIVYDRLLPSLAFALERDLLTLQDRSKKLNRETQFEANESWRTTLLQMKRPEDMATLRRLLKQETVLVVKRDLPKDRAWLVAQYRHKKTVGLWTVYY
ncbi:ArnT family glycosyltransferase [Pontibacter roseus]|uniref:ArnT family glycosyltransferase n=1 Tax=Pontibacter roseus TaxID=336989 RepID=UPI0003700853|nr:glycosyltransferase family 39 protein [Pontibacter roseus]